jgi:hypothetical protein
MIVEILYIGGLFKNVQMQGAQEPLREAYNLKVTTYFNTLSDGVCSATQQAMVPPSDL